ncbi:MAG TPA: hypothetical protein VEB22_09630, partial [Phycisphaerales bacterium]|nr:hypothetical protein [Phycisphaerales bacterium]
MPSIQELQLLFQAVSSLAIAGGLLYTAFQFRNFKRAQHVANFTRLVELQMHLREMRVEDPTLARVYRHDVQHAANDAEVREYFFNLMQLSVFEIVWFAHRHGQLPSDYYTSWDSRMREIAAEPSFRRMINTPSMKLMDDRFQAYIKQMV